jgi:hypothetical protein
VRELLLTILIFSKRSEKFRINFSTKKLNFQHGLRKNLLKNFFLSQMQGLKKPIKF